MSARTKKETLRISAVMSVSSEREMLRVRAVTQRAVVKWKPLMGMGHWTINTHWYTDARDIPDEYQPNKEDNYPGAMMWVRVDWEYLLACINVNLPSMVG